MDAFVGKTYQRRRRRDALVSSAGRPVADSASLAVPGSDTVALLDSVTVHGTIIVPDPISVHGTMAG